MKPSTPPTVDFDIAIIGAGMSGINMAYHMQTQAPPDTSYVILESRDSIGGTWDLFRYPGIRTDSDVHTFGFTWNAWRENRPLAAGDKILDYMRHSVSLHGIDKKIRFHHRVVSANWVSKFSLWSLQLTVGYEETTSQTLHTRFIVLGTGYYDYRTPLAADIPGLKSFNGDVIHPQFWPESFDYAGKDVVVIGSGATAVTLVPAMAEKAKRVTMLQRSPSYIYSLPSRDIVGNIVRKIFPWSVASRINRARWIFLSYLLYYLCTWFPRSARLLLTKLTRKQLPAGMPWKPHFNPSYGPWKQRLCFCPDGDFYAALRSGKAEVVTGTIKNINAQGVQLDSGDVLKPEVIVTATGLKMKFGGGIKISVDDLPVDPTQKFMWKGSLLQDVPNLVFVLGYFNASFTLGADVTAQLFVRLLNMMKDKGASGIVPRLEHPESMKEQPVLPLSSTYVNASAAYLPKAGEHIWAPKSNYPADMVKATWGDITTGLEFVQAAKTGLEQKR
ncbi:Fc.00g094290.m01.CDS01 [Cosmosporella sp. VM-42]